MTENPWQLIEDSIIDQYLNDQNPRPWVIAFSGGKDSTTLLQVVWNALSMTSDVNNGHETFHAASNPALYVVSDICRKSSAYRVNMVLFSFI